MEKVNPKRSEERKAKTVDPDTTFKLIFDYTFTLNHQPHLEVKDYLNLTIEIKPKACLIDEIDELSFV